MKKNHRFTPRWQPLLLLLGLLILVGLAACSAGSEDADTAGSTESDSIQNIEWQWTSVTTQSTGDTTEVPNPEVYTLNLYPDGTLAGKADCNNFSGTYSQENGFSITLGATTMAFCGEASLDQVYLGLLGSVAAGGPDGRGNLALESAGGAERMMFKNGGPSPEP
ncbi:MAG: META domain-containing protein [Anaerolineae bacterium]|nr:META domain-containing protein [Anaerolineae bacterium]